MQARLLRTACTAALLATAATAPALADPDPGGRPAPPSATTALTRLPSLYREAERATAAHRTAQTQLTRARTRSATLGRALAGARARLDISRTEAGRFARAQYQGGSELSRPLRLLFARSAQSALDEGHLLARVAARRTATLARSQRDTHRAATLATAARRALDRERALADRHRAASARAAAKLREVERTLAALTPAQLTALTSPASQRSLTASGALGAPAADRPPTAEGEAAVRYAVDQIGKPYVWGAAGPDTFDCSGLTSRAWAGAGRPIPRTSQEQWASLPRVPLGELRPGDLVVYFPKATHVGMYLGGGQVVHAPRPGAVVKVSPLAANPVLGAVRPDEGGVPLDRYVPPRLPEGAMAGPDRGYSEEEAPLP
ncbi:C40 family peptidase [Streptomyces sp. NPDC057638]|uniref:C40 family peptidase n=1 Tax=Streptomyces sp. NPDC057638 TaxID=3346190 RepID=UPI0036C5DEC3